MTHLLVHSPNRSSMVDKTASQPIFAEITRQRVPSPTKGLWMPRTDGVHPGQER